MISSASGFHTISCWQGSSIVSYWSISTSLPVPPPAVRKAISRRRPISRIVLGALKALTTYISLLPLLVFLKNLSGVSSDFINSVGTASIIFSSIGYFLLWSKYVFI